MEGILKTLVIIVLVILGFYWLIDHAAPLPLNHEQFGLYNHAIHRIIGIVLFIGAGIVSSASEKEFVSGIRYNPTNHEWFAYLSVVISWFIILPYHEGGIHG